MGRVFSDLPFRCLTVLCVIIRSIRWKVPKSDLRWRLFLVSLQNKVAGCFIFSFFFFFSFIWAEWIKPNPCSPSILRVYYYLLFWNNEHLTVSLIYIWQYKLHVLKAGKTKTIYPMLVKQGKHIHRPLLFIWVTHCQQCWDLLIWRKSGWKGKVNNKSKHLCLRYFNYYIKNGNETLGW